MKKTQAYGFSSIETYRDFLERNSKVEVISVIVFDGKILVTYRA